MALSRHVLSLNLDSRLLDYGSQSWNGHEAVYGFQQFTSLLPIFEHNLKAMYGGFGVGDARRGWGVAADLAAAMTGMRPNMATLRELGFDEATSVAYLIPYSGPFALAESPAARQLSISDHDLEADALVLFARADAHSRVSKPLLQSLRDEMRAYDASDEQTGEIGFSFRKLALTAGDEPDDFPEWDNRPLFLHEQKAFLDFLAKKIACEIVANNLVDELLGEVLCWASGLVETSEVSGEAIWNISTVSNDLLRKPVELVFSHVGSTVLRALRVHDADASPLDRLYVAENAVLTDLNIDISKALQPTRDRLVEAALTEFMAPVIDLRDSRPGNHFLRSIENIDLPEYEFPDLGESGS